MQVLYMFNFLFLMGVFMFDCNLNFTLKKLRKNRQSLFSFKLLRAKLLSFDDFFNRQFENPKFLFPYKIT